MPKGKNERIKKMQYTPFDCCIISVVISPLSYSSNLLIYLLFSAWVVKLDIFIAESAKSLKIKHNCAYLAEMLNFQRDGLSEVMIAHPRDLIGLRYVLLPFCAIDMQHIVHNVQYITYICMCNAHSALCKYDGA